MNHKLIDALLALRPKLTGYRPEKYYMRGPGPKTLSKLGEMYRTETQHELRERVPDEWLSLVRMIKVPDDQR